MITEREKEKLKQEVITLFKDANADYKVFDTLAYIDETLTYSENYSYILQQVKPLLPIKTDFTRQEIKSIQEEYKHLEQNQENPEELLTYENLKNIRTIGIYGNIRSGKTSLAYKIIEKFKPYKKVYFIAHPKPFLIKKMGYFNLTSINDIAYLNDCVIYWDEPQLNLGGVKDYMKSDILAKFCSLAGQRGITLIISTSDTRTFNARLEAYIELWLLKDIEYSQTKQRSILRKIILSNCLFLPEEFKVKQNQFYSYSRILSDFNGSHFFNMINEWNEDLSKPYKLTENS